ncbi:MAG: B12-binding domain-containing radical SAM protein [Lachnospiraceae bacterium]|nr:B12-binding domain-containing radical SAM protein [Lachnospiraceae bacterium]
MKKIVLAAVNAKYIHSNLAVYDLRAYAKEQGIDTILLEYTINQTKDEILKGIYEQQPDVLCISCYIWNISLVKEIICELHKILPDMAIWLGGPEVSFDAEKVLEENPAAAGVMRGEGERTFAELGAWYQREEPRLQQIQGITWRTEAGKIVSNPDREIMDLSEVPFPYQDLTDFRHRIIYYESSRGCPFSCSYCLSSVDKRLRFRKLSLVKQELQFFLDRRVPQVKFVDRTFNCKKEHAMAIWTYLVEHDNGVTNFHFEIAADLLTPEELALFARMRPGLIQLEIGVQSVNPDTITEIHRKMDFEKVSDIVRKVQANRNIHQHLDLIAGLPFENYESFAHSFDCVYALHPQQLQLGFLKVLKGSFMYEHAEEYGCIYQEKEPYEVLLTKWLPYGDILRLKQVEEMVEVYYNSVQFVRLLAEIERRYTSMFSFFEELGEFYRRCGYFAVSHTRLRRYEILLEFLKERFGKEQGIFENLAVLDVYARENAKSRPAFAPDQQPWKEAIRTFYQREEEMRRLLPGYEGYNWKQLMKMTHLEILGEEEPQAILFDYQTRDPLTQSARCLEVSMELREGKA